MSGSTSSSDEFEDAEDGLGPLPELAGHSLSVPGTPQREFSTPLRSPNECSNRFFDSAVNQPSTSIYVNVTTQPSLSPKIRKQEPTPVSRRGRLSVLRSRMRAEFGGGIIGVTPMALEDDGGSASESASLASWGRNLLMEHSSAGPIFPADSISTRAFSASSHSLHESKNGIVLTTMDTFPQMPSQNGRTLPPPPLRSPPPLPSSPCPPSPCTLEIRLPPPNTVPPPLPPRNPALRLPSALPPQVVSSFTANVPSSTKVQPAAPSGDDTLTPSESTLSSNSFARRRGHAKSKSLDRGLSLAKSMKMGPFPPPANKSNSLKRECSRECTDVSFFSLDGGEEDLRNSDAQGVIHQITSSILKEEPLKEETSSCDSPVRVGQSAGVSDGGQIALPSPSTLPAVQHVKKEAKNEKLLGDVVEEAPKKVDEEKTKKAAPSKDGITPVHLLPFPASEVGKDSTLKGKEEENHNIQELVVSAHVCVDPITRDVERRMSMKGHGHANGGDYDDGGTAAPPTTPSGGIERAATLVKEYGSLASGIFRGALSRARNVVSSGGTASRLPKEDEESANDTEREEGAPVESTPIVRPKSQKKGPFDFCDTRLVQELNNEHTGAVWCMKFSLCGRLLATAGQDNIVRVWVLRNHLAYFNSMRDKYNAQCKQNPTSSVGDNLLHNAMDQIENDFRSSTTTLGDSLGSSGSKDEESSTENCAVMAAKPLCTYRGHSADVLDLSWSRSYFILSSGMDRTVKLWHLSRPECLCCFQHMDFVPCIAFMPKDDRYFLSGSLDGKLRLWHIPDKKVALWNEVEQVKFITAIAFVKNGKFAVVGTYDGRCFFYSTDQLKYHTVIDVRSSRGKNARGHKVTGLAVHGDKLLVTSNDSRIRMYDLRDMALTCKFKGAQNERSQIRASFSPDGKHIVCGSEDRFVYVWTTADLPSSLAVRKDRNDSWQRIRCHSACVSTAIFAPRPSLFLSLLEHRRSGDERRFESGAHLKPNERQLQGDVIISADLQGSIKILVNRTRIKAGASSFFTADG